MLVYRKQSIRTEEFFQIIEYLPATNSTDILSGDFNYDPLKVSENKLPIGTYP